MNAKPPLSLWPDPSALGALTDLYQITMMAGYYAAGKASQKATFELFFRTMPKGRAFLVFAGLEQVIRDLLVLAFDPNQFAEIRQWPAFQGVASEVMDQVASTRFQGDVYAVPEGTLVFPGEPLVRVVAPLPQAQWVETHLLASIAYPTLVASKAARIVAAAAGRSLFEFGTRRGHGPLAGPLAARSAIIGGFDGTSNVEAARRLGVPAVGTMAHSWVQSFPTEAEAFATFARIFPGNTTLLVDTYDTVEGVRRAASIEPSVDAIRLDSGDLGALAKQARAILDQHGRSSVKIVASNDLDEYRIAELLASGAPIDAFGVGTELITSRDSPALSLVYKLVELDGKGKTKQSPGKATYPFAKQIFRRRDRSDRFCGDHVVRAGESAEGEPLLVPILQAGREAEALPSLDGIRNHCRQQLAALPDRLRSLDSTADYPVTYGKF